MTTPILFSSCGGKSDTQSFVYTSEVPPIPPTVISPTSAPTYTTSSSHIKIKGCYKISCNANSAKWTVQASGAGTLSETATHFIFETDMLIGETRVFSFTQTNVKGEVSAPTTLTITFDGSFELSPVATLINGGSSLNAPKTSGNGNYKLNVLTAVPSLLNAPIASVNGYVLTSGALNPQ